MPKSGRENSGMNAKQRRPLFVDGIYALIALAVIAGPLWILTKYLMDNLPWFNSLHSFASQIVGFSILGWVALVIISALIALIRRKEQGEAADWEFVAFVIIITAIPMMLTLTRIYLQNPR
jgi:uncharacterized membrane protein